MSTTTKLLGDTSVAGISISTSCSPSSANKSTSLGLRTMSGDSPDSVPTSQSKSLSSSSLTNTDRVLTSLAAGAVAGAAAKTAIAPLDRTKINFQTSNTRFSQVAALKFILGTYRNEGFFSLWRGNSATMARVVPYAAFQFCAHEQWKRVLGIGDESKKNKIKRHHGFHFVAGSLAGVTAQSLTYPLDTARARLAVATKSQYKNLRETFMKTIQTEGVKALYRGYIPSMIGVIPYAGFSFFTYESCKKWHKETYGDIPIQPWERLIFGAAGGVIGQTSSYPLDIVRRRMQVGSLQGGKRWRGGIFGILKQVYREEGLVHGVFKGLSMNWVKGPIAAGISFMLFDITQSSLRSWL